MERFSARDLREHDAAWDPLEGEALATAGAEYELLAWTGSCPEETAGQLAVLMSRMSIDTPTGELSYDPEQWDVARLRNVEDTRQRAGLTALVAAARHRGSGELAAYSVLQLTPSNPWLADQDDTLVAAGHRGHRLGMLVKLRNLRRIRAEFPAVERVFTYDAAENDHMLAINVALGFRPAGYDGEWQRALTA
ncbi:hypothetical protein [Arthrobacter sp. CG_A4]|uniref:hypothetical protein n=1 Tax=Arthrobacter sp. CG_A4 TaxID=3071706 RepID=UPI002DFC54C2|nr:hypothetical protein [Arthrobacter sp. CG_A4]